MASPVRRRLVRLRLVLLVSLLVPAATVSAQSRVEEGTRVRITTAGSASSPIVGRVDTIVGDQLHIVDEEREKVVVDRSSMRVLELSEGRRGNSLRGAAIGAGVGLGAAVVDIATGSGDADLVAPVLAVIALVVYPLEGAVLGLVVGSFIRTERWRETPLASIRWEVAPGPAGGFRIRVPL